MFTLTDLRPFMLFRHNITVFTASFALFITLLAFPASVQAQEWHSFTSDTGLFQVRIPDNLTEENVALKISPNSVAQSGHALAQFDQRPYKNAVKNYIIKYQQSFAEPLTEKEISSLIDEEMGIYAAHYKSLKGAEKKRKGPFWQASTPAGEIYLSYEDPELGEQSIRARIMFTSNGKFEQIVTGPDDIMDSFQTRKFFDSMVADDGFKKKPGRYKDDWLPIDSSLGIFTAYYPGLIKPYVSEEPTIEGSDYLDKVSLRFYDPIWRNHMFFNIYGYKMNRKMNYLQAENLMRTQHIKRHRFSDKTIEIERLTNDNIPVLETVYSITPPEGLPYASRVKLRTMFYNDFVLVQELIGSPKHIQATFADNLLKSTDFHIENTTQSAQ